MTGAGLTTEAKIGDARKAVADRPSWLGWLARLGMAAAGFLYCLIGFLAVELALGAGGKAADRTGALQELSGEWWGTALLVVIAVGFAGYALWRFAVAALGEKLEAGDDDLSIWKRLWYVARGLFYAFLCFTTVEPQRGERRRSGAASPELKLRDPKDIVRAVDSYASLLVLLLANFFVIELVNDARWGAVASILLAVAALIVAISDPDAGEGSKTWHWILIALCVALAPIVLFVTSSSVLGSRTSFRSGCL